jgi:hypothetical protein
MKKLFIVLITIMFFSCEEVEFGVNDLQYWLGDYEIIEINGEDVDCEVDYLLPEIISFKPDREIQIINNCTGNLIAEGDFEFENGLFILELPNVVFELQIFEDEEGSIRMYRCPANSGACTLRRGIRL